MKIIAHRGASGEFAENSLVAFEQELLQPSSEFILLHDSYLSIGERNNRGDKKVHFNQLPLTELAKFNICTLEQALHCINNQCLINIELKSAAQGAQLIEEMQKLASLIKHAQLNHLIIMPWSISPNTYLK